MLSYREFLIEKISEGEYTILSKKFDEIWSYWNDIRTKYRNGEIEREDYLKHKTNFEKFKDKFDKLAMA